ncbi:MAG: hypothetical protein OIF57_04875 [Marinobacterium sp.]|nr:hypothetical protein [Marinobacterium sp.]
MHEQIMNRWSPEQLAKMNEESFLVEMLDMIRISPEISVDDAIVEAMQVRLAAVEAALADTTETHK